MQSKISQHDLAEYLETMEGSNTVVTHVGCGQPVDTRKMEKGIVARAKGLASRLSRTNHGHSGATVGGGNGEEFEMQGVIVSYDVSRTVEEKVNVKV